MSTKWMKLLIGAGITASVLSLNGCGGDDAATATPALVKFNLKPVKGPFSKIRTISAWAGKQQGAFSSVAASVGTSNGDSFQVSVPLQTVLNNDTLIFSVSGDFSGDILVDGSKDQTTREIQSFLVPVNTGEIGIDPTISTNQTSATTIDGDISTHISTVVALKNLGLISSTGSITTTNMVSKSVTGEISAVDQGVRRQLGDTGNTTASEEFANTVFSARLLNGFQSTNSSSFTTFFNAFTNSILAASNPVTAIASSSFIPVISTDQYNRIATSSDLPTTIDTSSFDMSVATSGTQYPALFEGTTSFSLRLANFASANLRNHQSASVSVSVSYVGHPNPISYSYAKNIENGEFYRVETSAGSTGETFLSNAFAFKSTDTVQIPTVSTDSNVSATNISYIEVSHGGKTMRLNPATGESVLKSGATSYADFSDLIASVPVVIKAFTNDGAHENVSGNGAWISTSSTSPIIGQTSIDPNNTNHIHYFVTDKSGNSHWLSNYYRDIRGNLDVVAHGADFIHHQQEELVRPVSDLTQGSAKALLLANDQLQTSGMYRYNPDFLTAFAVASIPLNLGKTTASVALTSIATSERLTATFTMATTSNEVTVSSPKLQTLAKGDKVPFLDVDDKIQMVDRGLRYGHYAIGLKNDDFVVFQMFHVDAVGDVYSIGAINSETSDLGRYTGTKLGTVSDFKFSVSAENLTTSGFFSGRLNTSQIKGIHAAPSTTAGAVTSAVDALRNSTDVIAGLYYVGNRSFDSSYRFNRIFEASSGTKLSASTTAYTTGHYADFSAKGEASFILASPLDNNPDNEKSGFWVVPEPAGTASSVLTTRTTNPSAGFNQSYNTNLAVCPTLANGTVKCFVWGNDISSSRHATYRQNGLSSNMGMDFVREFRFWNNILPMSLNDGNHKIQAYWHSEFDTRSEYRNKPYGVLVGETSVIESGATSAVLNKLGTIAAPTVTLK